MKNKNLWNIWHKPNHFDFYSEMQLLNQRYQFCNSSIQKENFSNTFTQALVCKARNGIFAKRSTWNLWLAWIKNVQFAKISVSTKTIRKNRTDESFYCFKLHFGRLPEHSLEQKTVHFVIFYSQRRKNILCWLFKHEKGLKFEILKHCCWLAAECAKICHRVMIMWLKLISTDF